jgi:hypothetical protein
MFSKNFIYGRNFTNKVRVYCARRPALPALKQDPDPESDTDPELEPKLPEKSDPESDVKKIIPDPHPAGISEECLLQLQVVTQDL